MESFFYYMISVILATFLIFIIKKLFENKNRNKVIKNDLTEISKLGLIEFVRERHNKCGGVVEIHMGENNLVVSINDPELLKSTIKLGTRPKPLFDFIVPLIGKDNFQVYNNEQAANFRKLIMSSLGPQLLRQKYDTLLNLAKELIIDKWNEYCKNDQTVCVQEELLKFGLHAMVYTLLSTDLPDIDLNKFQQAYDGAIGMLFDKQMGALTENKDDVIRESIDYIKSTLSRIIKRRQESLEAEPFVTDKSDLCDILLKSNDPNTGKPFTEEMIRSHLTIFVIAGYHTTAIAVTWIIFMLTQHSDVFEKVRNEIQDNISGDPTQKDLEKCTYLDKVIKETLRVYTPGPFAARLIEDDLKLSNGYILKKGITLFYPLFAIHKNPQYWHDPEKFDPERFDEKNNIYPYSYCPFGYGPRLCPGDKLSYLEIRMILALIFQNFNIKLDMDVNDAIPVERFVLMAKNDIKIRLSLNN